jgi:hypothetical protein
MPSKQLYSALPTGKVDNLGEAVNIGIFPRPLSSPRTNILPLGGF